jgi:CBS-domain-containing membrane protein
MRRDETARRQSWWLAAFGEAEELAREFVKTHGQRAKDVMTRNTVNVTEDTPIATIAELLEQKGIKRVPVVRDGRLVGIVSRADLLRGLATRGLKPMPRGPGRRHHPGAAPHGARERTLGRHDLTVHRRR